MVVRVWEMETLLVTELRKSLPGTDTLALLHSRPVSRPQSKPATRQRQGPQ